MGSRRVSITEMVMLNCGIYMIYSTIDHRVYIGSSKNLKKRLERHFSELKNGNHENRYLQRFCNKHGLETIKYKILTYCCEENLLDLEIKYISIHNSLINGFNLIMPDRTIYTDKTRRNMSLAQINKKSNSIIKVIKDDTIIFEGNITSIKRKFNFDPSSIYKILKGIRKTHKKHTFSL